MEYFDLPAAIIFGIATLQGILLTVNLFFKNKGSRRANFFLMAIITVITLIIFQNFIILSGSYKEVPHLIFLFYPLTGLIGPLFYMYVLFLLYPSRKFKLYDLLHTVLFLYLVYNHIEFLRLEGWMKMSAAEYFYYSDHLLDKSTILFQLFQKLTVMGYSLASIYMMHTKIQATKEWSSDTNLQYINRFKLVVYLFLAYSISCFLGPLYSYVFDVTIGRYEVYHHIINSIIVVFLAMIAMQQPDRLAFILKSKRKQSTVTPSNNLVLKNLKKLMLELKPFRNPDLTIYELANLVNTTAHILSEQINKELKVNFYEFVNHYRVEEFKRQILSSENDRLTFLAVAYEVGFNSKTSFNRIFKKHTQMTPRQYLNQKKVPTLEVESKVS